MKRGTESRGAWWGGALLLVGLGTLLWLCGGALLLSAAEQGPAPELGSYIALRLPGGAAALPVEEEIPERAILVVDGGGPRPAARRVIERYSWPEGCPGDDEGCLDGWLARLEEETRGGGDVWATWIVLPKMSAVRAAYAIKRASAVIRGNRGERATVLVDLRAVEPPGDSWWDELRPYLDGCVTGDPAVAGALRAVDPTLVVFVEISVSDPGQGLLGFVEAVRAGASGVIARAADSPESVLPLARLAGWLPEGAAYQPEPGIATELPAGYRVPEGARTLTFVEPVEGRSIVLYWHPELDERVQAELIFHSSDFARPVIADPLDGSRWDDLLYRRDDAGNFARIRRAPLQPTPLVLTYERLSSYQGVLQSFEIEVAKGEELSAARIVALSQAVDAAQEGRLMTYRCEADVALHVKIPSLNIAFDLDIPSSVYFDREIGLEWEQKELFLNGIRIRRFSDLEIPMIQPEKVQAAPLEITLDKTYEYRLEGREEVDGRPCYRVAFAPSSATRSLYRGVVWIDCETFRRRKMYTSQQGLEPPIVANTETAFYGPVGEVDGVEIWLPQRIEGQQIFATVGRQTVVERDVELRDYRVNDAGFVQARAQAHAGSGKMMRDTESGWRTLERTGEGARKLAPPERPAMLFALTGTIWDGTQDFPLPLLGLNYYNFNLWDTPLQMNLLFGGAFLTLNLYHPDLGGTRFEAGSDLLLFAVPLQDEPYGSLGPQEGEILSVLPLAGNVNLARPLGDHLKLKATYELLYSGFMRHEDTASGFVPPRDGYTHLMTLDGEVNFRRTSLKLWGSWAYRPGWEAWGWDAATITPDRYQLFGARATWDSYPFPFTRLHLELTGLGGRDLDRFSKYQFGVFSNYLHGYGAGVVRADRAVLAKVSLGWSLANLVRVDLFLDNGLLQDTEVDDAYRHYPGVGCAFGIQGPWNLLIDLDYGYGIRCPTDDGDKGNHVVQLRILKTF